MILFHFLHFPTAPSETFMTCSHLPVSGFLTSELMTSAAVRLLLEKGGDSDDNHFTIVIADRLKFTRLYYLYYLYSKYRNETNLCMAKQYNTYHHSDLTQKRFRSLYRLIYSTMLLSIVPHCNRRAPRCTFCKCMSDGYWCEPTVSKALSRMINH